MPEEYVAKMVAVFREVRRVLRKDGTLWLNMGDSYCTTAPGTRMAGNSATSTLVRRARLNAQDAERAKNVRPQTPPGLKPKDLVGIPWRLAFALQADGWWLRCDIIWSKNNPMPESVTDRPTKAHEYVFLMTRSAKYYYDAEAIRENDCGRPSGNGFVRPERISHPRGSDNKWLPGSGRNARTVWEIPTQAFPEAHFAVFPEALVEPCVKAGSRQDDTVLDPFAGSGTTGVVCLLNGRNFIGIELNPEYAAMARRRLSSVAPLLAEVV